MKKLITVFLALTILTVTILFSSFTFAADPVSMTLRDGITKGYFYSETIATGATGSNVKIPPMGMDGTYITCTIHAGANTGKFQFTTSSDAAVLADTATWIDWPKGVVTGTNYDALTSQVTGLRGVSAAGEVTIEIVY